MGITRKQQVIHLHSSNALTEEKALELEGALNFGEIAVEHSTEDTALIVKGKNGKLVKISPSLIKTQYQGEIDGLEKKVTANKDAIAKLNGVDTVEGSVSQKIKTAISGLTPEEVINPSLNFVTAVSQTNGKIQVTKGNVADTQVSSGAIDKKATVNAALIDLDKRVTANNKSISDERTARETWQTKTYANDKTALETSIKAAKTTFNDKTDGHIRLNSSTSGTDKNIVYTITENNIASSSDLTALTNRVKANETSISALSSATHFIGVTNTAIKEGDAATSKIVTDNYKDSRKPESGDIVIYEKSEFIASGNPLKWVLLGDTTATDAAITEINNNLSSTGTTGLAIAKAQGVADGAQTGVDLLNSSSADKTGSVKNYIKNYLINVSASTVGDESSYISEISQSNGIITASSKALTGANVAFTPAEKTDITATTVTAAINEVANDYKLADTTITTRLSKLEGSGDGSVSKQITSALSGLELNDTATTDEFVTFVSQSNGQIEVGKDKPKASGITFNATTNIQATDVQAAINEVDTEVRGKITATDGKVSAINNAGYAKSVTYYTFSNGGVNKTTAEKSSISASFDVDLTTMVIDCGTY